MRKIIEYTLVSADSGERNRVRPPRCRGADLVRGGEPQQADGRDPGIPLAGRHLADRHLLDDRATPCLTVRCWKPSAIMGAGLRKSAVFKADGAETGQMYSISEWRVGRYRVMYVIDGDLITIERVDRVATD